MVSEMTNEELAKELLETVGLDGPFCVCDRCETVREAAARLRDPIIAPDAVKIGNQMKDLADQNDGLRRRLKVAEEALVSIFPNIKYIERTFRNFGKVKENCLAIWDNGINPALDAIREEK